MERGFVKLQRSDQTFELIQDPLALHLLTVIALRARFTDEQSIDGLRFGQAKIGDWKACGMTQKQYRCAKARLARYGLATFAASRSGTIATLIDSRVFSLRDERTRAARGEQRGDQRLEEDRKAGASERADVGRTRGEHGATNQNGKNEENAAAESETTETTVADAPESSLPSNASEVREYAESHSIPVETADAWWAHTQAADGRLNGGPIHDWRAAFISWAQTDALRRRPEPDGLGNADFWAWIDANDYPREAANRYVAYNKARRWKITNPLTKRIEPIFDHKRAFAAFFESLSGAEKHRMGCF